MILVEVIERSGERSLALCRRLDMQQSLEWRNKAGEYLWAISGTRDGFINNSNDPLTIANNYFISSDDKEFITQIFEMISKYFYLGAETGKLYKVVFEPEKMPEIYYGHEWIE